LHTWPEAGVAELMREGQPVSDGTPGDLICTGLMNADMPLIRYRVGDRASLPVVQTTCECGRSLPQMTSIEGRADDVLYTTDGRRVGRLDPVFKGGLGIREAQIIQEALDRVRLRFVAAPQYRTEDGEAMIRRIQERMGRIEVVLEPVSAIARTANGKFRAVICNLPTPHTHQHAVERTSLNRSGSARVQHSLASQRQLM
jgi:phenylacetate-CoA ligase